MKIKSKLRIFLNKSIVRLIVLIFAVILPINVLTLLMSDLTIREAENQITVNARNDLNLSISLVDAMLTRMKTRLNFLSTNDIDFIRLNLKPSVSAQDRSEDLQASISLRLTIDDIMVDYDWISNAYVYFPEKDIFLLSGDDSFNYREASVYIQALIADEQAGRVYRWTVTRFGEQEILLLLYKNRNAYFGAWINLESLIQNLDLDVSRDGNLLFFADDQALIGTGDPALLATDFLHSGKNLMYGGQNFIPVIGASDQSDLILVEFLSKGRMAASLPGWLRTLQIISLLALLVIPTMLVFLRRWIIHPIRSLTRAIAEIERGNLDFRIAEQAHGSEFDQINRNFNQMMDQVKDLKIDVYENKLEKQNIKMRYLAQQIQPHFILNAMNILYSYEPEEYPLIRKMIQCLAKYFRYIVKVDANFVRIDQELEHISNYFEIQKARYPDTFFAQVDYEPSIGGCLVPPLIVQNFAENAIKHSLIIGNKIDITVKAESLDADRIRILISDTGEGIPQEILDKIETFRTTRQYQEGLGVGIQNSIERLDILYAGKTELKFMRNENPRGTTVEITVPRHEDLSE